MAGSPAIYGGEDVTASLVSHPRPLHEMLRPNFLDQAKVFESQFAGMAFTPFTYADFEKTRARLGEAIRQSLTENDRSFLLSFKRGEPDWTLFPHENICRMPAVLWKLSNIRKLKEKNPDKHAGQLKNLEDCLAG